MARVLIPLAQGCEELEAVTLIDLLRRAGIEVISAGLDAHPVTASRGTVLIPDAILADVLDQDLDMLVLPGGLPGADNLNAHAPLHRLLQDLYSQGKYIAAICAAPKVLAKAGLLDDKRATGFPGVLEALPLPTTHITQNPVEIDGKLITSRGPGTAMDFALVLIELLLGQNKRQQVEGPLQRP